MTATATRRRHDHQDPAAPCWHIVFPDGADVDLDGSPVAHYDTEDEARADIADRQRPELIVGRYERPCVTVECSDGCGEVVMNHDRGWLVHFPGEEAALDLLDDEFVVGDDGKVRCEQDAAQYELAKVGG